MNESRSSGPGQPRSASRVRFLMTAAGSLCHQLHLLYYLQSREWTCTVNDDHRSATTTTPGMQICFSRQWRHLSPKCPEPCTSRPGLGRACGEQDTYCQQHCLRLAPHVRACPGPTGPGVSVGAGATPSATVQPAVGGSGEPAEVTGAT